MLARMVTIVSAVASGLALVVAFGAWREVVRLRAAMEAAEPRVVAAPDGRTRAAMEAAEPRVVSAPDGSLLLELSDDRVLQCVYGNLAGVRTAEQAYDAAFDEFSGDLRKIGFEIDAATCCDRYLLIRALTDGRSDFQVEAVVTRGGHAGRRFVMDRAGIALELKRVAVADLGAVRRESGWVGDL